MLPFSASISDIQVRWATQRTVFGRSLSSQPVIRFKLAKMISLVECCQYWLENLTYQMTQMDQHQQSELLAGYFLIYQPRSPTDEDSGSWPCSRCMHHKQRRTSLEMLFRYAFSNLRVVTDLFRFSVDVESHELVWED